MPYLQQKLPNKQFIFRADGEFRTPELLLLCDKLGIDFVVGYASNAELKRKIDRQIKQVEKVHRDSGKTERIFTEFLWTPSNDSWQGRSFRVIAIAMFEWYCRNLDYGDVKSIATSIVVAVRTSYQRKSTLPVRKTNERT